ncbi:MAG: hypothetical protein ACYC69_17750 [Thermodesulfovibrionales bacterium]
MIKKETADVNAEEAAGGMGIQGMKVQPLYDRISVRITAPAAGSRTPDTQKP